MDDPMDDNGTPDKPLRISEVDFDSRPDCYPGLVLTGDARTRGRTYGRVFADKIMVNVARHLSHPDLPEW
jgi:hypothetical protein